MHPRLKLRTAWALLLLAPMKTAAGEPSGSWSAVSAPFARSNQVATYDAARDRMVVFGGEPRNGETWTLSLGKLPRWTPHPSATLDSSLDPLLMILDAGRDRLVLVGNGSGLEVWKLDLAGESGWEILSRTTGPPGRSNGAYLHDTRRGRILLFGGREGGGYLNDVWSLSLADPARWTRLQPEGTPPPPRGHAGAAYDPVRDRAIFIGGWTPDTYFTDEWALDFVDDNPVWSRLSVSGPGPSGRVGEAVFYDPVRDRVLLTGGRAYPDSASKEVWSLTFDPAPAWTELLPSGAPPAANNEHSLVYDPLRDRLVFYGGNVGTTWNGPNSSELRCLSLAAPERWSTLIPERLPPSPRYRHTAVLDTNRNRMLIHGGSPAGMPGMPPLADTWALSLRGDRVWTRIEADGDAPPLEGHAAVYVPPLDAMVVFGGLYLGTATDRAWVLRLSGVPAWQALEVASGAPSPRHGHSAVYDPVGNRMIVFGGRGADGSYPTDVWALSFEGPPSWLDLTPVAPGPAGREGQSAIYDSRRGRMVLFGGYDATWWQFNFDYNDVWEFLPSPSPHWGDMTPESPGVHGGGNHTAVYDPSGERMVVYGGYVEGVQVLSLLGEPSWRSVTVPDPWPLPRTGHTAVHDRDRSAMVMFGGQDLNDTWILSLEDQANPGPTGSFPRLDPPSPNPFVSRTTVTYTLAERQEIEVAVYDIQGRPIQVLRSGVRGPGLHFATWDGRGPGGGRVASGVYLIRLLADGEARARKVLLLP